MDSEVTKLTRDEAIAAITRAAQERAQAGQAAGPPDVTGGYLLNLAFAVLGDDQLNELLAWHGVNAVVAKGLDMDRSELEQLTGKVLFGGTELNELSAEQVRHVARGLIGIVHDYEFLAAEGSSRREREIGRAARYELADVCTEVGVRVFSEQFRDIIDRHKAAYEARLKELGGEINKASGRLSWWNL
jgi:hypothetical protein